MGDAAGGTVGGGPRLGEEFAGAYGQASAQGRQQVRGGDLRPKKTGEDSDAHRVGGPLGPTRGHA
jgi:hypothetical protein